MVVKINKIAKELKIKTPDLITRPIGRVMYQKIVELIKCIGDNEVVVLDFEEIKVIDSSFIDEFLVKIMVDQHSSSFNYHFKLKNISPITEINIDSVFKTYSNYNKKKIVIITESICQNNNFFIGTLSDTEKGILDYLRVNRTAKIKDLVEYTGFKADNVKGIMKELDSLRLVRFADDEVYHAV